MRTHTPRRLAAALLLLTGQALALTVSTVSPQGEVAQVRQLVVRFDEPAAAFGQTQAPAPVTLSCTDAQATAGSGRWTSDREWVYRFAADLPPGLGCTVQRVPGWRAPNGAAPTGPDRWRFSTGGPFVQAVRPGTWERIDEEQVFLLQLNGAATPQSLQERLWCAVEGLGERVPVRPVDGPPRAALLKALGLEQAAAREPARHVSLTCARRLPPAARVTLVYGAGVRTPSGVAGTREQRFTWQVREPFTAEFACEREQAQAGCLPIRPLRLTFNAPVARRLAEAIVLQGEGRRITARVDTESTDADAAVTAVRFPAPLPERATFTLALPAGFQDDSGRPLRNAGNFPLKVTTAPMPPLAKFAAAPFGIVERLAEGPDGPALLPVTLRQVEGAPAAQGPDASRVAALQPRSDAEIIGWYRKVRRYHAFTVPRAQAAADVAGPLPRPLAPDETRVQTRMLSLLAGQPGVRTLALPAAPNGPGPRPFEVVGIPLPAGFHVVEIESPLLGRSLLDERHGPGRTLVVRTAALVTNLGVHVKLGRENALAWVTTLDRGRPVAGATVTVSGCDGRVRASATTDDRGVARFTGLSPRPPRCPPVTGAAAPGRADAGDEDDDGGSDREAWFVSARARDARGLEDLAFTWSDWNRGIEPWRFNLPTSQDPQPDRRAHTVLDRTLLRAGETVSMKHLIRTETAQGFGVPGDPLPGTLVITHVGSGQAYTQPLIWRRTATGGRSAESQFAIPTAARLGQYQIELRGDGPAAGPPLLTGDFRVEAFRLPVLEGSVAPVDRQPLVAPRQVPVSVQVRYVAGGPAVNLPVRVSALVRSRPLQFPDHADFSFQPPRGPQAGGREEAGEDPAAGQDSRVIADRLALTLDRQGGGRVHVDAVPAAREPRELLLEATYADPNGEVQTLRSRTALWPAAVIAGIRTEGWVSAGGQARLQALALGLDGQPAAGVPLAVRAVARITTTTRKRLVGGFYTYDNRTEVRDLGPVCEGTSDRRGLLLCDARLTQAGEVELTVTARDRDGRSAQAAASVWVTRQGELWFGGEDHDRMDLLPEKKAYQPGETARLQVRMPFRQATALVTVEREGILEHRIVTLDGQDPTVELTVQNSWGPNVYVSVLALRGRLREVPWYSFFTWGFRTPRVWWQAFRLEGRDHVPPTALVDLSKPAYRLGVAEIRVGTRAHRLDVQVQADRARYPVRGTATVTVTGRRPDGQPAAGAEVALAVVDESLLELMPNPSWALLEAMLQRRSWGVETSTAQMEIIGRRHYGRKAVPAGGGGGRGATRELLDTLAYWHPRVTLDAGGRAVVPVPLNDALTRWRIVAVADAATGLFGTGQATVRTEQDLQIISGLPPLVREGDRFRAAFTLRNTTPRPMQVVVTPRATLLSLPAQQVALPAGEAREVAWDVEAPAQLAFTRFESLLWDIAARDTTSGTRDALKVTQRLVPAVPLTVQQATLVSLDGPRSWPVAPPPDALGGPGGPPRGGLRLTLQPRLGDGLPGVRDWWAAYPYACLEQKSSRALGLRDARAWQVLVAQLPTYLDADGLAHYYPPRDDSGATGSDILTSHLLAASHEAAGLDPAFALPDAVRSPMLRGLTAFVEGRLTRELPVADAPLTERKLAAIAALARHGQAQARWLATLAGSPNQWSTGALLDWQQVLRRVPDAPQREQRLAEAAQILRARLAWQGTRVGFSTERTDARWWMMANADVNGARLLLAALDDPAWQDELGRLASGLLARQQGGAWSTTTANLWGSLAMAQFSARTESVPVTGATRASLGPATEAVDWSRLAPSRTEPAATNGPPPVPAFGAPAGPGDGRGATLLLPWTRGAGTLTVAHQGSGRPWLTLQSLAAVPLQSPFDAGFAVHKTIAPVEPARTGVFSRGDLLRVTLDVRASADMGWVVVSDPIPAGASILGSGLGRDSEIATRGERREGSVWPAFEERSPEAFRSYYAWVPKGRFQLSYTLRLNQVGRFTLPPTRVEAMYAPEMAGEAPNVPLQVEPAK